MSTRAIIVMLLVSLAVAVLQGLLSIRIGYWALLLSVPTGLILGRTLSRWDIRAGKKGWFS